MAVRFSAMEVMTIPVPNSWTPYQSKAVNNQYAMCHRRRIKFSHQGGGAEIYIGLTVGAVVFGVIINFVGTIEGFGSRIFPDVVVDFNQVRVAIISRKFSGISHEAPCVVVGLICRDRQIVNAVKADGCLVIHILRTVKVGQQVFVGASFFVGVEPRVQINRDQTDFILISRNR